jgi:hypothetical protein
MSKYLDGNHTVITRLRWRRSKALDLQAADDVKQAIKDHPDTNTVAFDIGPGTPKKKALYGFVGEMAVFEAFGDSHGYWHCEGRPRPHGKGWDKGIDCYLEMDSVLRRADVKTRSFKTSAQLAKPGKKWSALNIPATHLGQESEVILSAGVNRNDTRDVALFGWVWSKDVKRIGTKKKKGERSENNAGGFEWPADGYEVPFEKLNPFWGGSTSVPVPSDVVLLQHEIAESRKEIAEMTKEIKR